MRHSLRLSLISLCFLLMQVGRIVLSWETYLNALEFDAILSARKEELNHLLIGLYGEHLLPATMYDIEQILRCSDTITGYDKNKAPIYIISKKRLKNVFARLRNRTQVQARLKYPQIMQHIFSTGTSRSMKSIWWATAWKFWFWICLSLCRICSNQR